MNANRLTAWLIGIAAVAAWISFIIYCGRRDWDACVLAIVFPPIFGTALLLAMKLRSVVLTLFMGFTFVAHSIGPSYFFLRKQFYSYGGDFGAVKAFSFTLPEIFRMYAHVIVFTFALLAFVTIGVRIARRTIQWKGLRRHEMTKKSARRAMYDYAIVLFILLIAVPQAMLMFKLRLGITGLISPVLPFRLTGIMYYTRAFLYPLALFSAYSLSRRYAATAMVMLLYAFIAGMSGSSRYILLATAAPVFLFSIIDRRRMRLLAVAAIMAASFVMVTHSRQYIYSADRMPFGEYLLKSVSGRAQASPMTVVDVAGGIANRLNGPQDIVLAYQYEVPGRLQSTLDRFTDKEIVPDLTYDLYGIIFPPGSGFGIGLGIIPWMIMLSGRSFFFLIFFAGVIAVLLVLADIVVLGVRATQLFNASAAADPLAFFLVYVLYTAASLKWYYQLLTVAFIGVFVLRFISRIIEFRRTPRIRRPRPALRQSFE